MTTKKKPTATQRAVIDVIEPGEWATLDAIALRLSDAATAEIDLNDGDPVMFEDDGTERRLASVLRKMKSNGHARTRTGEAGAQLWTITPSATYN